MASTDETIPEVIAGNKPICNVNNIKVMFTNEPVINWLKLKGPAIINPVGSILPINCHKIISAIDNPVTEVL